MKRILLLEDDSRLAGALSIRLRKAGFEVLHAPDPGFGVLLTATRRLDLIISDIWMPIMQGFTFIRQWPSFDLPPVPVIFLTASPTARLRDTARDLGAKGLFEKPYDPEQLIEAAVAVTSGKAMPGSTNLRHHETDTHC